jgi:hypothetical protein
VDLAVAVAVLVQLVMLVQQVQQVMVELEYKHLYQEQQLIMLAVAVVLLLITLRLITNQWEQAELVAVEMQTKVQEPQELQTLAVEEEPTVTVRQVKMVDKVVQE